MQRWRQSCRWAHALAIFTRQTEAQGLPGAASERGALKHEEQAAPMVQKELYRLGRKRGTEHALCRAGVVAAGAVAVAVALSRWL